MTPRRARHMLRGDASGMRMGTRSSAAAGGAVYTCLSACLRPCVCPYSYRLSPHSDMPCTYTYNTPQPRRLNLNPPKSLGSRAVERAPPARHTGGSGARTRADDRRTLFR